MWWKSKMESFLSSSKSLIHFSVQVDSPSLASSLAGWGKWSWWLPGQSAVEVEVEQSDRLQSLCPVVLADISVFWCNLLYPTVCVCVVYAVCVVHVCGKHNCACSAAHRMPVYINTTIPCVGHYLLMVLLSSLSVWVTASTNVLRFTFRITEPWFPTQGCVWCNVNVYL